MIGLPQILAVAAGGAAVAVVRFLVSHSVNRVVPAFPVATFAVNLVGSFAIGVCFVAFHEDFNPVAKDALVLRDAVRVGFLGALTTFSTFSLEGLTLIQKQQHGLAAAYLLGSVALGLGAAAAGVWVGKMIWAGA